MPLNPPPRAGAKASQEFVPIEQIRDGIVILDDGSMRAVLMTSSINIALKSEDEQVAIITQFQNLLNSLDFSVQFFVQSRELDIRPYLALLEEQYKHQESELMKIQVREYIEFIRGFTEGTNIMSKSFFVVVPYTPTKLSTGSKRGVFGTFLGGDTQGVATPTETYEQNRMQLEQRIDVVVQGLARCGIRAALLGTEEAIELFYKMFNIGELDRPMILDHFSDKGIQTGKKK